ncbi:GNAT family N-acetyltransferase [Nonomuraea sp. 3-1Str]|uniref:GNAT family N-acetyltransferase n=1 Tax=Nonomuraea sp. 3-1Str TaxID=2929801 RepID=UPI00285E65C7|nr:GNAT family protein [Nonomuraea sp. 3-1Str]MDR8414422.1 GNAT family N-acetyltransferase [Nonomuraea sp. 3-1Str]
MRISLADDVVMRPVAEDDAQALTDAYVRNRDHLRRWEPRRPDTFFTLTGQSERLEAQLQQCRDGRLMPWVLADGDRIVGCMNVSGIVYGAFHSANLGYWLDAGYTGRGLATRAVAAVCRDADERLGLHRVEAATLLDNVASQRVLEKAGFEPYGVAPNFIHIDGQWRDHRVYQRILNDRTPTL